MIEHHGDNLILAIDLI